MVGVSRKVNTKVWKDRGKGAGYGYVSVRKKIITCSKEKIAEGVSKPSKSPGGTLLQTWLRSMKPVANQKAAKGFAHLGEEESLSIVENAILADLSTNERLQRPEVHDFEMLDT